MLGTILMYDLQTPKFDLMLKTPQKLLTMLASVLSTYCRNYLSRIRLSKRNVWVKSTDSQCVFRY